MSLINFNRRHQTCPAGQVEVPFTCSGGISPLTACFYLTGVKMMISHTIIMLLLIIKSFTAALLEKFRSQNFLPLTTSLNLEVDFFFSQRFTLDKTQIKYWFKNNRDRTSSLARGRPWTKWHPQDQRLIGCPGARPPPPSHLPPTSLFCGCVCKQLRTFRRYRRDSGEDSSPMCTPVCDLGPLRPRNYSPRSSCNAIKWGGHMAGHVSAYGSDSGGI